MSAKRRSDGLIVPGLILLSLCPRVMAGPQWRVIPVEVNGQPGAMVADFALGSDGIPWAALAGQPGTLCTWQNGQWHKVSGEFQFDPYRTQLHVSPAGRVYLSQPAPEGYARRPAPPKPHYGALYLLTDKRAEYVTEYYYDTPNFPPRLFFDSKGRIWNWGEMFLAKFENGEWERVEANLGLYTQVIEDAAGDVYFFGKALSYCRNGRITANAKPLSFPWEQPVVKGYLWGTDKVLFLCGSNAGVMVFDLKTLEFSDVLRSAPLPMSIVRESLGRRRRGDDNPLASVPSLARSSLFDAFRDKQGNVWILALNQSVRDFHYIKVRAADNGVEERPETAAIDWGLSMDSRHQPVLCARDGVIYIGGRLNGVYLCRDDMLTHVDWKQGLAINETNWVCEHPDGTIWFASRRTGVAVYDPHGTPDAGLTSPFQTSWEEYRLAANVMVRDIEDSLWCCLKDQAGKVSRWNGQTWEHYDLGFDTADVRGLWVDDLQRLFVMAAGEERRAVMCRLAHGRVERFADFKEMLVDSVRTGSRQFKGSGAYYQSISPLVIGDREIWCIDGLVFRLMRYDGQTWNEVKANPSRSGLFRHKDNQVLIGTDGRFETLDRGQIVEFANEYTRRQEYLLGESGVQPFDETVYAEHRGELFLAREVDRILYIFETLEDFHAFTKENVTPDAVNLGHRANRIGRREDRIRLADGGFWARNDRAPGLQRYYRGLLLRVDLSRTPVVAFSENQVDVFEDSGRDLWIRRHETLFRVKRPQLETRITAPLSSQCDSPTVRVSFVSTTTGESEPLQYAWRLDGGMWSKPSDQTYADLEFVQPGAHEFEVTCIGQMGNLDTTPAVLKLDVTIPVPEVKIVSASKEVITDLDVAIRYEVVKRPPGSTLSFQWRIDEGAWHDTRELTVRPSDLKDGQHLFEVRAVADGKYIQTLPASVRFSLKADYEKAIRVAIQELRSPDFGRREVAVKRLVSLGQRAVPALRNELTGADEDVRWWIQAALAEIEK